MLSWTKRKQITSTSLGAKICGCPAPDLFVRAGLEVFLAEPWSKRRTITVVERRTITEWLDGDVALPDGVSVPSLAQLYRALDAVAAAKPTTEEHLYGRLIDVLSLNLRLCCYDLTSTYFDAAAGDDRFPSKKFGYSRDHRGDRPQVMIGLLVTGEGVPIAHHVFAGNTNDASTLTEVLTDLQQRFGSA